VKIVIYNDTGIDETLTFSDYYKTLTIDGTDYVGLGQLMNLTETVSDLRATPQELTVTISGIPTANLTDFLTKSIKGSDVSVLRGIFNPQTGALLAITGNPAGRFFGIVNNYAITEDYPETGKDASNSISIICNSNIGTLDRKTTGRFTNPVSQKSFYPSDLSMDRVPNIAGTNLNFGAPEA
jgi:hypothetical protein